MMRIYMAGSTAPIWRARQLLKAVKHRLASYAHFSHIDGLINSLKQDPSIEIDDVFLDSGAFTAWSLGKELLIDDYLKYISENEQYITQYSVLDVIGDAEGTLKNQKYMEEAGYSPIPCFHFGEPWKYLQYYIDNYDYVSIGGMVGRPKKELFVFLNHVFEMVCDKDGVPKCKVHGFGVTSSQLLKSYPWYSVDSSSWVVAARTGIIYVPHLLGDGHWDFLEDIKPCRKVPVLRPREHNKQFDPAHFLASSSKQKEEVMQWLKEIGASFGISEFKKVGTGYALAENEVFVREACSDNSGTHKTKISRNEVEVLVERGVSNYYVSREVANIWFFRKMQEALAARPMIWQRPAMKSFFGV